MPTKKDKKNEREYNYIMTVFEEAECWGDLEQRLREENATLWAMIKHDRDIYTIEDEAKEPEHKAGTPKRVHYHVCLELVNASTFNAMKNKYPGAHIEKMLYKKSAYPYLIHKNNEEKAQYDYTEIITNNLNEVKYLLQDHIEYEVFDQDKVFEYLVDGTTTPYRFIDRFGVQQYNKWYKGGYSDLLLNMRVDEELIARLEHIKQEREHEELVNTLNAEGLPWEYEKESTEDEQEHTN